MGTYCIIYRTTWNFPTSFHANFHWSQSFKLGELQNINWSVTQIVNKRQTIAPVFNILTTRVLFLRIFKWTKQKQFGWSWRTVWLVSWFLYWTLELLWIWLSLFAKRRYQLHKETCSLNSACYKHQLNSLWRNFSYTEIKLREKLVVNV